MLYKDWNCCWSRACKRFLGGRLMKMNKRQDCFTLIELLVVIAIIGIIAGMVFKMMVFAGRASTESQAKATMEKIALALEEFRAEYGIYPPATNFYFEYDAGPVRMGQVACDYFCSHPETTYADGPGGIPPGLPLFKYGLIGYLWYPNGDNPDYPSHHPDSVQYFRLTARDIAARKRWTRFVEDIKVSPDFASYTMANVGLPGVQYTNRYEELRDFWHPPVCPPYNLLIYRADEPFISSELRSCGPDAVYYTKDDITRTSWDK